MIRVASRGMGSLLLLLAVLSAGCVRSNPTLYDVEVEPKNISPNADGVQDVARIDYRIGRRATLSVYLIGPDGERYPFREEKRRSPGEYTALFGGNIGGRVLPDGEYRYVIEATPLEGGEPQRVEGQLTISGADTTRPELEDFTVFPDRFSPNQDGIEDRVTVSYYLTKPATVDVFLLGPDGTRYPVTEKEATVNQDQEGRQLPGRHEYDYDAGVDADAPPPPDGTYTVVAEAVDQLGNVVREEAPLTIVEGGVPRVEIVGEAAFEPEIVSLGETLVVTMTVENIGTVPLRTTGPASGTEFESTQNFNSLDWPEESGAFRVGVDFQGNTSGRPYPYRWRIGEDDDLEVRTIEGVDYFYLPPGKRVQVVGRVKIVEPTYRIEPTFWAGLIHEDVRIVNDRVSPTAISIQF